LRDGKHLIRFYEELAFLVSHVSTNGGLGIHTLKKGEYLKTTRSWQYA